MKKRVIFGFGLACLACCIPLLLPVLGAGAVAGAAGWLAGLDWAELACLGLAAAVAAAILVLVMRRGRRKADGPYCDLRE
jgi:membrane protein implicated in regulation of membrane protease activity